MSRFTIIVIALTALAAHGCQQQEAKISDVLGGASGDCGPWYAQGEGAADGGTVYAIDEGATFPCAVWTSVRKEGEDTWFNVGELYLEAKNGLTDKKALLLFISGQECPACFSMIEGINERKADLEAIAEIIAVNRGEPALELVYDLDEAVDVMSDQGWPSDWPITNDVEDYVLGFENFPWIVLVRLSDMQVIEMSNDKYSSSNVSALINDIEDL
jgi:hypothetical protein